MAPPLRPRLRLRPRDRYICPWRFSRANGGLGFTAYSARTGKPVRVLYQYRGASCFDGISTLQWTNASATEIIGATQTDIGNQGGKQAGQLGVITNGNIRLLKLPKSVSPTYYGIIAF